MIWLIYTFRSWGQWETKHKKQCQRIYYNTCKLLLLLNAANDFKNRTILRMFSKCQDISKMILSITMIFFKSAFWEPEYSDNVSPIYYPTGANIFWKYLFLGKNSQNISNIRLFSGKKKIFRQCSLKSRCFYVFSACVRYFIKRWN